MNPGFQIIHFAEIIARMMNTLHKDKELSAKQLYYINLIAQKGETTVTELSKQLNISKPSVTGIISRFVDKQIVVKVSLMSDRRSYLIKLSEKGMNIQRKYQRLQDEVFNKITNVITHQEMQTLLKLTSKISKHLE